MILEPAGGSVRVTVTERDPRGIDAPARVTDLRGGGRTRLCGDQRCGLRIRFAAASPSLGRLTLLPLNPGSMIWTDEEVGF
jgi:hypothetical protein